MRILQMDAIELIQQVRYLPARTAEPGRGQEKKWACGSAISISPLVPLYYLGYALVYTGACTGELRLLLTP
jgi:hypothetical protein